MGFRDHLKEKNWRSPYSKSPVFTVHADFFAPLILWISSGQEKCGLYENLLLFTQAMNFTTGRPVSNRFLEIMI